MLTRITALVLMLMLSATAHARPDEPIVVVSGDTAFTSALDDALVAGGMAVLAVGPLDEPSSAKLTSRSRELADAQRATATVWMLPAPDGATLVTYDRKADRLLVRELPYQLPLTAPQAAEAARMVRTMLRALRVPDEPEHVVAPPPVVPTGPPPPWLAATVGVGAWFAAPGNDSAFAASLGLAWRPQGLGVAVTGVLAPAAELMRVTFVGEVRDVVVAAEVRRAIRYAPSIHITPAAGLAMHFVRLSGTFAGGDLKSRRLDPAARLGVTVGYALPRGIDLGLAVSADCLLRRQRYEVASEEILVVPRLQIVTGLLVGMRL